MVGIRWITMAKTTMMEMSQVYYDDVSQGEQEPVRGRSRSRQKPPVRIFEPNNPLPRIIL